jgi:hypothetical protein
MIYLSGAFKREMIGRRADLGIMLTYRPRGEKRIAKVDREMILLAGPWAFDNNCFNDPNIDVDNFLRHLDSYRCGQATCLFAVAPDVVGDPHETWSRSKPVLRDIRSLVTKAAYVAQDGQEKLPVHWEEFDCLFIGGSTEWKLSEGAFRLVSEAKRRGKWTHMGRVNSRRRIRIGAMSGCDSTDGTMVKFGPDKRIPQLNRWLDELQRQPLLLNGKREIGLMKLAVI